VAESLFGLKVSGAKGQWLLVSGLALFLVGVILFTGEDDEPAPAGSTGAAETAASDNAPSIRAPSKSKPAKARAPRWTRADVPPLHEALAGNPFGMSQELQQALGIDSAAAPGSKGTARPATLDTDAKAAQTLSDMKARGVNLIVATPRGRAALVGGRLVREGQVVGGLRIVAIDSGGLVVEPVSEAVAAEQQSN